jgi:hypothetical protein
VIKELIKLATQLDARGYYKEADYLDALLGKNAHEEEASEGSNKLVSKFALILEIEQPPGLDDLISQGQQKYSDMLPEGESFAKIDKSHVTLIPGKIFKTINKDDQSAIVEKLGESTVLTPIVDTSNIYLATREMEGRKTLYLKLDNSEAINSAVQEAVAEVASINVPKKYMHMSIANVHGGNSYQSVGDINENDEYDENKVIVSAVQQKKKEKKPQQKKKGGPGDLVKRLKGTGMPDNKIREILSKAHPNLPEKAVDNMLANITASRRDANMIKELIKLANALDKRGLMKEADYLDSLIRKESQQGNPFRGPVREWPKNLQEGVEETWGDWKSLAESVRDLWTGEFPNKSVHCDSPGETQEFKDWQEYEPSQCLGLSDTDEYPSYCTKVICPEVWNNRDKSKDPPRSRVRPPLPKTNEAHDMENT